MVSSMIALVLCYVVHVLWECPVYDSIRDTSMKKFYRQSVGRKFKIFRINNLGYQEE